jgi:small-conductance mechanosensitive channel
MKDLLHFMVSLIIFAVLSIIIAILFGGLMYLLHLVSIVNKPSWTNVLGMAFLLWVFMILNGLWRVAITAYRWHKDPVFKDANIKLGISWESYQRIKHKDEELM